MMRITCQQDGVPHQLAGVCLKAVCWAENIEGHKRDLNKVKAHTIFRIERVVIETLLQEKVCEISNILVLWELMLCCCLHHHVSHEALP